MLPEIRVAGRPRGNGRGEIRLGLVCMLLATMIYYLAGGYSAINLPFPIPPAVSVYLSPLLFLSGLGLSIYGVYLRITA